ncbi:helix-turn-helix domain-containing protein [Lacrimispora sp.]|uniref:helix-turn-helix domain-containing protein n=1 Tax=Lacrimispora sp. TaxID=2719234 RepID=UPI0028A5F0CB|nr:helix-turn-helix transcriptional regulator [Lacrimispora sp.]
MISYNPLWKLLVDKGIQKSELRSLIRCNSNTIARMARNEYVSMANIDALCFVFNCKVSDIIEYVEAGDPKEKPKTE